MLVANREQYVTTVVEKLMSYAIGRELAYFDAPAVRRTVRASRDDEFRWSSIVLGVCKVRRFR